MNSIVLGLLGVALAATAWGQSDPSRRFSQSLSVESRTSAGLPHLDSDEVAILDALVRRDSAAPDAQRATAATFSQRLSADEYRHAGLGHLTAGQLVNLDALIAMHESAPAATPRLTDSLPRASTSGVSEKLPARELHGAVFLEVGGGRGFSERAGGIALRLEDPARHMAISVGYTERHVDCH
ncbi:hypothetical protein K0B96_04840 [Horticoccus luteus]|uniref:Uncharacterized protein n=1 Tax=Horticoccus luteus TaxID=2862869 RepID=A0A8F9TXR8_9BACT|nr:hypothetical protein [Horticoccus luteus]QYM79947.1 hypothetical protein K0B96_04840 [Horticoccus luteus]